MDAYLVAFLPSSVETTGRMVAITDKGTWTLYQIGCFIVCYLGLPASVRRYSEDSALRTS